MTLLDQIQGCPIDGVVPDPRCAYCRAFYGRREVPMTTKRLDVCAFCPAPACTGLTVIPACETHWDDPEREAWRLEAENRQLREALGQIQTNLINCQVHRALCVHEQDSLKIANEALGALD